MIPLDLPSSWLLQAVILHSELLFLCYLATSSALLQQVSDNVDTGILCHGLWKLLRVNSLHVSLLHEHGSRD